MSIDDYGSPWSPAAVAYLAAPVASNPMPSLAEKVLGWQDYLSPSHDLNLLLSIWDVDVLGSIAKAIAGDWERFAKAGDALRTGR